MIKSRFSYLFDQYFKDSISSAEEIEFFKILGNKDNIGDLEEIMKKYWSEFEVENPPFDEVARLRIIDNVIRRTQFEPKRILPRLIARYAIAASMAIVLLSIGIFISRMIKNPSAHNSNKRYHVFAQKNTTLMLSDGTILNIDDAASGQLVKDHGLEIRKTAQGKVRFTVIEDELNRIGTNTIQTPAGRTYEVVLQDGSKITLNAGSSISFPVTFGANKREINLVGEAYFEVAKEKRRPFIVSTPQYKEKDAQQIQVLGTVFNINAYPNVQQYVTTLLEGAVKISTKRIPAGVVLHPGQEARVNHNLDIRTGDITEAVAWKDGYFYFRNESLTHVMNKLENWYDIEVIYDNDLPALRLSAEISRARKLSEVLAALQQNTGLHFILEGRRVKIMH